MADFINKEKIVFVLAALLFVWGLSGVLSPENPTGRIPRGKKLAEAALNYVAPDLGLKQEERVYRPNRGRDWFAEPVALKPLPPLELDPPPLARAPITAPPPVPGPPPAHWRGLRMVAVAAASGAAATAATAATTAAAATAGATETKKAEEEKIDPDRTFDSIIKRNSTTRIYGRIRNRDPLSLAEGEKDGQVNQLLPRDGVRIEFDYFDIKTGLRRGAETLSAASIDVFSLAGNDANLYAVRRWRIPADSVKGRLELARWLVGIGRVEWAAREYRETLRLDPRRSEIYLELGQTLEREYLWEEALECYRSALAKGVETPSILYREGLLLRRFEMPERAASRFRDALRLDRGNTRARLALGECLLVLGEHDRAIAELKRAHGASAPTGTPLMRSLWEDASVALGRCYLASGNFKEAIRYLRAVVDQDDEKKAKRARRGLGAALFASGSGLDEALDLWSGGDSSPITRLSAINRGYGLARKGSYAEAREAFLAAMREDPLHADLATVGLAFVAECEGQQDEALERYEEAAVLNPTLLYTYLAIGRIQRKLGDNQAASASLQKVLDRAPDAVDALLERARVALAVNQPMEAQRYLARALALESDSLDIKAMLGTAMLRAQREQEAFDTFSSVLARRDDDPIALTNLAVIYYRRGEVPKAIGHLQTAIEAGRDKPTQKVVVDWARRAVAEIDDNDRKRLWQDDFNRSDISNGWELEHPHGVHIRIADNRVRFNGTQQQSEDKETALLREVSLGELVTFDAVINVPAGTKAKIGIEILVRRSSRSGANLRGAIQLVRDSKGRIAYRIHSDGEFQPWQKIARAWPVGSPVRLGLERTNELGHLWNLTMDGDVLKRGLEVKALRGWNRDGLVGVFGTSKIGADWSLELDNVRMILRLKK